VSAKRPKPPPSLGKAGAELWRSIVRDLADGWELDSRELALLERACRCSDELVRLEAAIDADGITTDGSKGQVRVHPALVEARQLRLTQLRLLGSLELSDPAESVRSATAAQQQARRAAQIRWADHEKRASRRG
jgi:P27 family predicted phage terminase small subunit